MNLPATQKLRGCGFNSWVGKIPWRRKQQPTPVFLPGESHGQRNPAGYIVHGVAKSWTRLNHFPHTRYLLVSRGRALPPPHLLPFSMAILPCILWILYFSHWNMLVFHQSLYAVTVAGSQGKEPDTALLLTKEKLF